MAEKRLSPSTPDYAEAWSRTCRRLRAELGEDVYNSWFHRLELDEVENGVALLSVPTKFLKSWIHSNYTDRILATFSAEASDITAISVCVRLSSRATPTRRTVGFSYQYPAAATQAISARPPAITPRTTRRIYIPLQICRRFNTSPMRRSLRGWFRRRRECRDSDTPSR